MSKAVKIKTEFVKDVLKMAKEVGLEKEYNKVLKNLDKCRTKSDALYAKYKKVSFEKSENILKELNEANDNWEKALNDKYSLEGEIIDKYFENDENRKIEEL